MSRGGYRHTVPPLQNAGMHHGPYEHQPSMGVAWHGNGPSMPQPMAQPMAPYHVSPHYAMVGPGEVPVIYNPSPPVSMTGHGYPPHTHMNSQSARPTPQPSPKVPVGRVSITTCTKCNHNNYLAECELSRMDRVVKELETKEEYLSARIKELEEKLEEKETLIKELLGSKENTTVNPLHRVSNLSANAEEFNPKSVPVVSAKVIEEEENMQLSPPTGEKEVDTVEEIASEVVHKESNASLNYSDPWNEECENAEADKKIKTETQIDQADWASTPWEDNQERDEAEVQLNQDTALPSIQNTSNKRRGSERPKVQENWRKTPKKNEFETQKSTNAPYSKPDKGGNRYNQEEHTPRYSHDERSSRYKKDEERTSRDTNKQKQHNRDHSGHRSRRGNEDGPSSSVENTGGASKREWETPQNRRWNNNDTRKNYQSEGKGRRSNDPSRNFQESRSYKDQKFADPVKNIIEELNADLFTAPPEYSLAHCVAADFRMGSGIAVKFKQMFRRTGELLDQRVDVGGCAYLEDKNNKRYIFYLVTKHISTSKPTYITFRSSLEALKEKCVQLNVTKLAIPHIGCGLDRLDWDKVKGIINEVFSGSNVEIRAYEFNEEGLPEAEGNRPKPYGVFLQIKVMELRDIDKYAGLLFFGTEDGYVDSTAKRLDERLHFLSDYKSASKSVGSVWCWRKSQDYYVYSLIVQTSFAKNKISFIVLENFCKELMKICKVDETTHLGLECLAEWSDDPLFTEKMVTMLRHILYRPVKQLWVCFKNEEENVRNTVRQTPYS